MRLSTLRNRVQELEGYAVIGAITMNNGLLRTYSQRLSDIDQLESFVSANTARSPASRVSQEVVNLYQSVLKDLEEALKAFTIEWAKGHQS